MANEEALLVVVGVDEPAGDSVGIVASNLALRGVEDIDAPDFDRDLIVGCVVDPDVRLAEDNEEIPRVRLLQIGRHVKVGIHAGLQNSHPAEFVEV